LTSGYTHRHPEFCEVTRALVMVRRFTGRVEPNVKFPHGGNSEVHKLLDRAARVFEQRRETLHPVKVI